MPSGLGYGGIEPDKRFVDWRRPAEALWSEFEKMLPPRLRGFLDDRANPWADGSARARGGAVGVLADTWRDYAADLSGRVASGELTLDQWREKLKERSGPALLAAAMAQYGGDPLGNELTWRRLSEAQQRMEARFDALAEKLAGEEISLAQASVWAGQGSRGLIRAAGQMGSAARFEGQPVSRVMTAFEDHCLTCPGKAKIYPDLEAYLAETGGWPGDGSDQCHGNCLCSLEPATEFSVFGDETGGLLSPTGLPPLPTLPELPTGLPDDLARPLAPEPGKIDVDTEAGLPIGSTSFLPPPVLVGPKWSALPLMDGKFHDADLHTPELFGPRQDDAAYGAVVFDDQGRVLLRRPTNEFGGYAWTWPKGKQAAGDHPIDTAVREVAEETGYTIETVGLLRGGFSSGSSTSHFFVARAVHHDPKTMHWETEAVEWLTPEEAVERIKLSSNTAGRARDLKILEAALTERKKLLAGEATYDLSPPQPKVEPPPAPVVTVPKKPKKAKSPAPPAPPVMPEPQLDAPRREQQAVTPPEWIDLDDGRLRRVGGAAGSNPAGWYEDEQGKRHYVKFPNSSGQVAADLLGRRLSERMGLPSTGGRRVVLPDGSVGIASEEQPLTALGQLGLKKRGRAERTDHLVHAVLTRNWDVVGLGYDNLLLNADGKLVVVDHGGGLLWRAQGDLKPGDFADFPAELTTLRTGTVNPTAPSVFGDITDLNLARAIRKRLKGLSNRELGQLIGEVGFTSEQRQAVSMGLIERREYMLEWADGVIERDQRHKAARKAGLAPGDKPVTLGTGGRTAHPQVGTWRDRPTDHAPDEALAQVKSRLTNGIDDQDDGHLGSRAYSATDHWAVDTPYRGTLTARAQRLVRSAGNFPDVEDEELDEMLIGVSSYSRSGYRSPEVNVKVQKWLDRMPGWDGLIVRGINAPHGARAGDLGWYEHEDGRGLAVGDTFSPARCESFSTAITTYFNRDTVVVIMRNTRGASIRGVSDYYHEHEVIVGQDSKLKVVRVDVVTDPYNGIRKTMVYCEETNPHG